MNYYDYDEYFSSQQKKILQQQLDEEIDKKMQLIARLDEVLLELKTEKALNVEYQNYTKKFNTGEVERLKKIISDYETLNVNMLFEYRQKIKNIELKHKTIFELNQTINDLHNTIFTKEQEKEELSNRIEALQIELVEKDVQIHARQLALAESKAERTDIRNRQAQLMKDLKQLKSAAKWL